MGRHQRRLGRRPRVTHSEVRALIVRDLRRHEAPHNSRRRIKPTQAMYGPNFTRRRLKISLRPDNGPSQPDAITVEDYRRSDQTLRCLIYANSITPEYRIKVGKGVPRLGCLGDPTIRREKKDRSVVQAKSAGTRTRRSGIRDIRRRRRGLP